MKRQRISRRILSLYLGITFSIAAIGFSPLPNVLARGLHIPSEITPSDCIVLLGGGVTPDGQLSTSSLERTTAAAIFFRKGLAPKIIISTGVTLKRAPHLSESKAMGETLTALGIPEEVILLEEQSRRTAENAREVSRLMKEMGCRDALLVTSAFHMKRSLLSFAKHGVKVHPAPVPSALDTDRSFFARIRLFDVVCHEYLGMLYYRLRGWV